MNMLKSAVAAVVATGICLLGFASDAIPQTNTASNAGVDIKRAVGYRLGHMRGSILPDSLNVRATGKEVESCALRY